jgi:hypothetical protein
VTSLDTSLCFNDWFVLYVFINLLLGSSHVPTVTIICLLDKVVSL